MANQNNEAYQQLGYLKDITVSLSNIDRTKTVDITLQMLSMVIYEDIFANTLYGTIEVDDSIGLMNGLRGTPAFFPIVGEEFIDVSYEVAGRPPVGLTFCVYNIEQISNSDNFKNRKYLLKFASEEHLTDAKTLVQKSYKSQITDMATDIFTSYLKTQKVLDIQNTMGQQALIIPRLSPFESLNFLAKRSVDSDKFKSASFVCFENTVGFHFCDIETLIKKGFEQKKVAEANTDTKNYYNYFIKNPNITESQGDAFKTVITFEIKSRFDTVEKLKRGYFESDTLVYDYVNHQITDTRFKFKDTANTSLTVGAYPENSATFIDSSTSTANNELYVKKFMIAKDTSAADTFLENIHGSRAAYMTRLSQNMTTIETYGDPVIKAGDVINVKYPEIIGTTKKAEDDYYLNGEFLIGTIQHKFTTRAYLTKMDIYKNGYNNKILDTEDSTSIDALKSNKDSLISQQNVSLTTNEIISPFVKIFK
jgi:hypothetical protein